MADLRALIDDPDIPDDEVIYRIVAWSTLPADRQALPDGAIPDLHGNAFSDYPPDKAAEYGLADACMSVVLRSKMVEAGRAVADLIADRDDAGVAESTVGQLRRLTRGDRAETQGVMWDPKPQESAHAVVFQVGGGRRNNAVKKAMAREFRWTIPLIRHDE